MSSSQGSTSGDQVSSSYLLTMLAVDLTMCFSNHISSSRHSMAHVLPRERLWHANFVEVKDLSPLTSSWHDVLTPCK